MRSIGRCALMAAALVSWMSAQEAPESDRPTVEDVLASAEAAYSGIDAFAATGRIDSEIVEDDGSTPSAAFEDREFDVFFARPDTLMIMVIHPGSENYQTPWSWMLNAQGGQANHTSSTSPPTITSATLEAAIGAASSLASHVPSLVAGLLLPEAVSRFRLRDLVKPSLLGEESIGGVTCWKVAGTLPRTNHAVTLWIAQPSGLVCQSTLERREGEALHRDTIAFESVRVRAVGELAMRSVIGGPAR